MRLERKIIFSFRPKPYLFKGDHRYPGSNPDAPVVILYAQMGKSDFQEFHRVLTSKVNEGSATYVLRHYLLVSVSHTRALDKIFPHNLKKCEVIQQKYASEQSILKSHQVFVLLKKKTSCLKLCEWTQVLQITKILTSKGKLYV